MSDLSDPRGPAKIGRPTTRRRAPNGTQRFLPITVTLDPILLAALDERAKTEGIGGRSEIIRRACREYLRRAAKRSAQEGDQALGELMRVVGSMDDDHALRRFLDGVRDYMNRPGMFRERAGDVDEDGQDEA